MATSPTHLLPSLDVSAARLEHLTSAEEARYGTSLVAPRYVRAPLAAALGEATDEPFPRDRSERWCRAMNVAVAGVSLVLLAPIMLLVALAVRCTSAGPVIYCQTRVGLDRRRRGARLSRTYDRRQVDLGG